MSYRTLDEYSKAKTFDDFHDAKIEAKRALKENDSIKAAIAIGNMVAHFELLWQHRQILAEELENKTAK